LIGKKGFSLQIKIQEWDLINKTKVDSSSFLSKKNVMFFINIINWHSYYCSVGQVPKESKLLFSELSLKHVFLPNNKRKRKRKCTIRQKNNAFSYDAFGIGLCNCFISCHVHAVYAQAPTVKSYPIIDIPTQGLEANTDTNWNSNAVEDPYGKGWNNVTVTVVNWTTPETWTR
jgi:hypothetical protein